MKRKVSEFEDIQMPTTLIKLKDMFTRFSTRRMFWSRTRLWSLSFFLWMAVIIIWIWPLHNINNFIHNDANKYFNILMVPFEINFLTDRERERFLWCFLDFLECFLFFEWWCWHSRPQSTKAWALPTFSPILCWILFCSGSLRNLHLPDAKNLASVHWCKLNLRGRVLSKEV